MNSNGRTEITDYNNTYNSNLHVSDSQNVHICPGIPSHLSALAATPTYAMHLAPASRDPHLLFGRTCLGMCAGCTGRIGIWTEGGGGSLLGEVALQPGLKQEALPFLFLP